jgi:hypothetical protein
MVASVSLVLSEQQKVPIYVVLYLYFKIIILKILIYMKIKNRVNNIIF